MSRKPRTKGAPPSKLTGQMPVSSYDSPWWDRVASEISSLNVLGGKTMAIEELTQLIPAYPDGRRARARTVARRLAPILELVQRGPNGSRGKEAVYRIIPQTSTLPPELDDDLIPVSQDWLDSAIEKMTRSRK